MKKLIFVFTLILVQRIHGQDTIFKINKEILIGKIGEITPTEVIYKKADNLYGPSYVISSPEIFRIKYENGFVDTLNRTGKIKIITANNSTSEINNSTGGRTTKIHLNDGELKDKILSLPASGSKDKLQMEFNSMMKYKRNQIITNTAGWLVGFAVPTIVTSIALSDAASYNNYDPFPTIVAGALTGAAIRTMGQILRKINKNKKLNARRNIDQLFGEMK